MVASVSNGLMGRSAVRTATTARAERVKNGYRAPTESRSRQTREAVSQVRRADVRGVSYRAAHAPRPTGELPIAVTAWRDTR